MLVFIDESGDPGFAIDRGSSRYFVIVCVIFKDELEAEKLAVMLKELRRSLKIGKDTEFKFNKSRKKIRISFLRSLKPFAYSIRALVVDKKTIRSTLLKTDKYSFYSYFIKQLLKFTRGTIKDAKVKIDGSGDRVFKRSFISYLRKELNSKNVLITRSIKFVDSRQNMLIQVADMIAGTIRRYKEAEKSDGRDYWDLIKDKITDCWDFK